MATKGKYKCRLCDYRGPSPGDVRAHRYHEHPEANKNRFVSTPPATEPEIETLLKQRREIDQAILAKIKAMGIGSV